MKLIIIIISIIALVLSSCNHKKSNFNLFSKTLKKIERETPFYLKIDVIDECTCIITEKGGELVDTISKKIFFGELDKLDTLINHQSETYISYYQFKEGKGIDIIKLIPFDSSQIKKLPHLYEKIERECDIFGFQHKNYLSQREAIKNLKKIAIACGASISITHN